MGSSLVMNIAQRIVGIETALGARLPQDYRAFLGRHREDAECPQQVVSTNADYWGVRSLFEIGDGEKYLQVDEAYKAVGAVIPEGTIAIAEDSSGNLYLLDCRLGAGGVYWWDHERDLGDDRVEKVADSFTGFLASLIPESD